MRILLAIILLAAPSLGLAQIKLYAVGYVERHTTIGPQEFLGKDVYIVSVLAVNYGQSDVTLPTREMAPVVLRGDDKTTVLFFYETKKWRNREGYHDVVPSRESFAPVILKPGECAALMPFPYFLPMELTKKGKVLFRLETTGYLEQRFGFSGVEIESEMILREDGGPVPRELDPRAKSRDDQHKP